MKHAVDAQRVRLRSMHAKPRRFAAWSSMKLWVPWCRTGGGIDQSLAGGSKQSKKMASTS